MRWFIMPKITLVTQKDSRLTKLQQLDGTWETAGNIFNAQAKTINVTLSKLPALLDEIGNHQALILGTTEHAPCKIVTADAIIKGADGIARTKDNFSFSDGPSLVLLDIDFKQCPHDINPIKMLTDEFGEFGYVMRGSTTSGIIDPDGTLTDGNNGCHIYVQVEKGKDIPRMLETIQQQMLLAGHGFVFISEAGTPQIRTPVDVTVGSPERVVYEAPPVLLPGYTQNRESEYVAGDNLVVNELSKSEKQEITNIEAKLLEEAQPKVDAKREEWQIKRGLTEQQANEVLDRKTLPVDFVITKNDKSTFTVGEVWASPEDYHSRDIRDPLEPEYGKTKAKIYVNRADNGSIESIIINSQAHGGLVYRLQMPAGNMFDDVVEPVIDFMAPPVAIKSAGLVGYSMKGNSKVLRTKMLDDTFVIKNMAVLGEYTIFYAPPNAGKTLITLHEIASSVQCGDLDGNKVFYINADDTYKGLVTKLEIAEEYGFEMLAPSHNDFEIVCFVQEVERMVNTDTAKGVVVILDTLKKFADLMDKQSASKFNLLMRSFVSKGGTVIALAHVNKLKDIDGKNIHAGTTDMRDDCDCVYVANVLNDIGENRAVEFTNEKMRSNVHPTVTFKYIKKEESQYKDIFDSVELADDEIAIEARSFNRKAKSALDKQHVIDSIKSQITTGVTKKTDLVKAVHEATGETRPSIIKLLDLHVGTSIHHHEYWLCEVGDKNVHTYSVNEVLLPPELLNQKNVVSFL